VLLLLILNLNRKGRYEQQINRRILNIFSGGILLLQSCKDDGSFGTVTETNDAPGGANAYYSDKPARRKYGVSVLTLI
jgi:hypothetical protein